MKASALTKFLNLLLEESDYRKTGYFAEKLMVSNKTISNYITELRWYMREYGLDITAKHGVGIRMEDRMLEWDFGKPKFRRGYKASDRALHGK